MLLNYFKYFTLIFTLIPLTGIWCYRRTTYDMSYGKLAIPLWKQRACEKAQNSKVTPHYVCNEKGEVKCLPGWQGDLCQVPMCRKGCDPMNGYCQRPGECRCRFGFTGESCSRCIPLPGCQHGDCSKPFECLCRSGWDGLFCTEPTCRHGCHNTRGYCEVPGECRCRLGWAGRNCSDCAVLPGCQFGTCSKPLECNCQPGYTGLLCTTPTCAANCHKQHGYCSKPGECRCKVGWTGANCDKCFPYPGCVNGDCEKPWECNCQPGWGGMLCNEPLTFCADNPNVCVNDGKCVSLTRGEGNYRCQCKQGYLGKNCEIRDEFMLTSIMTPRITPPPPPLPQRTPSPPPSTPAPLEALTVVENDIKSAMVANASLEVDDGESEEEEEEDEDNENSIQNNENILRGSGVTSKTNTTGGLELEGRNRTINESFGNDTNGLTATEIFLRTTTTMNPINMPTLLNSSQEINSTIKSTVKVTNTTHLTKATLKHLENSSEIRNNTEENRFLYSNATTNITTTFLKDVNNANNITLNNDFLNEKTNATTNTISPLNKLFANKSQLDVALKPNNHSNQVDNDVDQTKDEEDNDDDDYDDDDDDDDEDEDGYEDYEGSVGDDDDDEEED